MSLIIKYIFKMNNIINYTHHHTIAVERKRALLSKCKVGSFYQSRSLSHSVVDCIRLRQESASMLARREADYIHQTK